MKRIINISSLIGLILICAACGKIIVQGGGKKIHCLVATEGTKAGLITTESIKTEGFVMKAFAEDDWFDNTIAPGEPGSSTNKNAKGPYFTSYVKYASSGWDTYSSSSAGTPTDYMWLNKVPLTFWCWNGTAVFSSEPSYTLASGKLDFGYKLQGTDADDDLVLAYNSEVRAFYENGENAGKIDASHSSGSRTDQKVDIHFYHALSEVNFVICVESGDDSFDPSLVIKRIEIGNVSSSGTCTADGNLFTASGYSTAFGWTPSTTKSSFSQDFGPQTGTGSNWTDALLGSPQKAYRKTGSSFYMIPQALGTGATLKIVFSDDTYRETSFEADNWLPGKYYTYKLAAHAKSIEFTVQLIDWGDGGTYILSK